MPMKEHVSASISTTVISGQWAPFLGGAEIKAETVELTGETKRRAGLNFVFNLVCYKAKKKFRTQEHNQKESFSDHLHPLAMVIVRIASDTSCERWKASAKRV